MTRAQILENVRNNLETIRKVNLLTQEKFASCLNIKTPTYKAYVLKSLKTNFPPPEVILKLSEIAGCSINKIYSENLTEKNTLQQIKNQDFQE